VTRIVCPPGRFLPAFAEQSSASRLNEIWVDYDGTPVVFRQVVGILATHRLPVHKGACRARATDRPDEVRDRAWMYSFQLAADLRVAEGQHVTAGETVIATMPGANRAA
jgi:hypothetical protein